MQLLPLSIDDVGAMEAVAADLHARQDGESLYTAARQQDERGLFLNFGLGIVLHACEALTDSILQLGHEPKLGRQNVFRGQNVRDLFREAVPDIVRLHLEAETVTLFRQPTNEYECKYNACKYECKYE